MAKTAIVSGTHLSNISRGDDPPYPPRGAPDGGHRAPRTLDWAKVRHLAQRAEYVLWHTG